jgi:hypothetical protein
MTTKRLALPDKRTHLNSLPDRLTATHTTLARENLQPHSSSERQGSRDAHRLPCTSKRAL